MVSSPIITSIDCSLPCAASTAPRAALMSSTLDVLDARPGAHQLLRCRRLDRARLRLRELLGAHAVLELVELLADPVPLRLHRAQLDLDVVALGRRRRARGEQLANAFGVELGLLQRDVLRLQPRRHGRDLLAPRAGLGLLQRRRRRHRARPRLLELLRPRALLQLLHRRLHLEQLSFGGEALRVEIAGLEDHQRVTGLDRRPFGDQHLFDTPTDARADLNRLGLDGAAPLVGLAPLPQTIAAVGHAQRRQDRDGDEWQLLLFAHRRILTVAPETCRRCARG
jgi:hypothetical protein